MGPSAAERKLQECVFFLRAGSWDLTESLAWAGGHSLYPTRRFLSEVGVTDS